MTLRNHLENIFTEVLPMLFCDFKSENGASRLVHPDSFHAFTGNQMMSFAAARSTAYGWQQRDQLRHAQD